MSKVLMVGGGILGIGLLALLTPARTRDAITHTAQEMVEAGMGWVDRVITRVSAHEGGFDSLNLDTDGAGLSFGIIQWSQRTGALGKLLHEMYGEDPGRFAATFGPSYGELLRVTGAGSLEVVEGVTLWKEPWVSRFREAGRDPLFQQVQLRLAQQGEYFQAALKGAQILELPTERAIALVYDTAVQQGPGHAVKLARKVKEQFGPSWSTSSPEARLTLYAALAPAHFRRTDAPTSPYPVAHIKWKTVGTEWHAWAGQVDLYEDILRRRMGIVRDAHLGDTRVRV